MGSDNPQLSVELKLDEGSIKKSFDNIPNHIKGPGKKAGDDFADQFLDAISPKMNTLKLMILNPLTLAIAGVAGTVALASKAIDIMKEGISEAAQEQDSINRLNASLVQTGRYTEETARSLSDYATQMQKTTRFSDDAVLSGMAMLQTLTNLDEKGLKRATSAAADLAAGLQIDLQSAIMMVGKAAEGEIGQLGRYGLKVKEGATNAETFSNMLDMIGAKMGGRASSDVNSYTGSISLMDNAYKNMLGSLGDFIVKSPLVIAFSKEMSKVFDSMTDSISAKSGDKTFGTELAESFLVAGKVISYTILGPLETVYNITRMIVDAFMTAGQGINTLFMTIVANAANVMTLFLPEKVLSKETVSKLFQTAEGFKNSTLKLFEDGGKAAADLFTNPITTKVNESLDRMKLTVAEMQNNQGPEDQTYTPKIDDSGLTEYLIKVALCEKATEKFKQEAKKDMIDIGKAISQGLVSSVSQGVQAFTKELITGGNAFEALGKSVLSSMGDMSIKLGEMFLLQGIAVESMKKVVGGPAIAAGIALIALGSVMKAWSSAGSAMNSTPSTYSDGSSYETTAAGSSNNNSQTQAPEKQEPKTSVAVHIYGDVHDGDASGLRFVELIQNAIDKNGAKLSLA